MAVKVIMPKQGLQMTEGTIIKWLVREGEKAVKDTPLFEMETDKLTIVIDAPESGTLLKVVRGEGETVPITETIAVIGAPGEDISGLVGPAPAAGTNAPAVGAPAVVAPAAEQTAASAPAAAPAAAPAVVAPAGKGGASPRAIMLAGQNGLDISAIPGSGPGGYVIERDVKAAMAAQPRATPLAKKEAQLSGVALGGIVGTGAHGKVTRADVAASATPMAPAVGAPAVGAPAAGTPAVGTPAVGTGGTLVPFAGMRKVIAARMKESQNTMAQTSHRVYADMTEAARVRAAFKDAGGAISYNDIVCAAVCRALQEHPSVNAQLTDEGILLRDTVNLGIAVAVEGGLIVPVIRGADTMGIAQIGAAAKGLAEKARSGQLTPDEYKGGSFTVSNLGMFGLESFVAIINPPEAGILAVGAIEKKPVAVDDAVVIRPMMSLTLSYDHRIVDGAPAALFLVTVKKYIEQPYLLL